MPNTLINELHPLRIEAGSVITIADGTTTFEVIALEPGTLKAKPGGKDCLEWTDRGVQQTPSVGDDQNSEFELTVKMADTAAAVDILQLTQQQQDATTLLFKLFTIAIKMPKDRTATVGRIYTLATAYFAKPGELSAGAKFDQLRLSMRSKAATWTVTTY